MAIGQTFSGASGVVLELGGLALGTQITLSDSLVITNSTSPAPLGIVNSTGVDAFIQCNSNNGSPIRIGSGSSVYPTYGSVYCNSGNLYLNPPQSGQVEVGNVSNSTFKVNGNINFTGSLLQNGLPYSSGGGGGGSSAFIGAQVTSMSYYYTINNGSVIALNLATYDPLNSYNTQTYIYTVPTQGYYKVTYNATFYNGNSYSDARITIRVNGNWVAASVGARGNQSLFAVDGSAVVYCQVNDTLDLYYMNGTSGNQIQFGNPSYPYTRATYEYLGT